MNTTTAPQFKVGMVIKLHKIMTKIMVHLVDAIDTEVKKEMTTKLSQIILRVGRLFQLQTTQKLNI